MTGATAFAVMLMLASAEQTGQACVKRMLPLGMTVRQCIESEARKLEPSGESADDIATAAVSACGPAREIYLAAVSACGESGITSDLSNALDQRGHQRAVEIVVEIRAAKHSATK